MKHIFEYSILIVGTFVGAFVLSETLRWIIKRAVIKNAEKLKIDPTNYSFLKNATSFIIYTIAVFFVIYYVPRFRALGTTLFASAGIFAAVIALASQQAFSNVISGIFIVISKPFRVGDFIELSVLHKGTVEDITLRHTVIRDIQNSRIIVPNSKINTETIVNYHLNDERKQEKVEIIIDIDSDVDKAIEIIKSSIVNHKSYMISRKENGEEDELTVWLIKIDNGAMTLRAMVGSEDPDRAIEMHYELNYIIKKRFEEEGIQFAKRVGVV